MTTYDAYASYNRMAGMPYPYGLGGASQLGAGASAGGYSGMSLAGSYSSSAGIDMMHPAMQAYASKYRLLLLDIFCCCERIGDSLASSLRYRYYS